VVAYDFGRGRQLVGRAGLDQWYERFLARAGRMPLVSDLCERLATHPRVLGLAVRPFTVELAMDRAAYVAYVMTDAADPDDADLRRWCDKTLVPVFGDAATVLFTGYLATFTPGTRPPAA